MAPSASPRLACRHCANGLADGVHGRDEFGDVDADGGAVAGAAFDFQVEVGAVQNFEAFADVAEADALDVDVGHFFFGDADAIVFNFDAQAAGTVGGARLGF